MMVATGAQVDQADSIESKFLDKRSVQRAGRAESSRGGQLQPDPALSTNPAVSR